jgi:osmotically-inducible protein OsmY
VAGEKISDVRILAVIKAKYVLDRDLSARDIAVDVSDGAVTLTGTVPSPEFVGRATALALETDGARSVTARLTVRSGN